MTETTKMTGMTGGTMTETTRLPGTAGTRSDMSTATNTQGELMLADVWMCG